jgi:hypothetical protein
MARKASDEGFCHKTKSPTGQIRPFREVKLACEATNYFIENEDHSHSDKGRRDYRYRDSDIAYTKVSLLDTRTHDPRNLIINPS